MAYACKCANETMKSLLIGRSDWDMVQLKHFCPGCVKGNFEANRILFSQKTHTKAPPPLKTNDGESCDAPFNNLCNKDQFKSRPYPDPFGRNVSMRARPLFQKPFEGK